MSWASDKAREILGGFWDVPTDPLRVIVERAIHETLARVRSEVAMASRGLPEETRAGLDAAIRKLGEP